MPASGFHEHHTLVLAKVQRELTAADGDFRAGQLIGKDRAVGKGDRQDDLLCLAAVEGDNTGFG